MKRKQFNVLICSYLEPELVGRIAEVNQEKLNVIYRPDLLGKPRYPADHYALPDRTPEQESEWNQLLKSADILFDFDFTHKEDLPDLAPQVQWIQATSAGIGNFVARNEYAERMPNTIFTTASGVHARPLAEYVIMTMLIHYKNYLKMHLQQQENYWSRLAGGTDLEGKTVGIIGVGKIGKETARLCKALGMYTMGTDMFPVDSGVDRFFKLEEFHKMLPLVDVLVLSVPHTPQTEKMIGMKEFKLMSPSSYLVNIARGAVIDELELIEALQNNIIGGAALDVAAVEPLPAESPLWNMENVIVTPHSASTSDKENARLADLFCENLGRYLAEKKMLNVLNPELQF